MSVKLLTEHQLEFLSLKVGCTGSSIHVYSCQNATLLEITFGRSYLCVQAVKAFVRLCICPGLSEPLLLAYELQHVIPSMSHYDMNRLRGACAASF